MDVDSRLLDSLQTLSKLAVSLLLGVVGVSVYLVQRSVDVAVFWTDPFNPNPQSERWGLAFSYLTLSIVWPVVLGGLCFGFNFVVAKMKTVLASLLIRDSGLTPETLSSLVPLLPGRTVPLGRMARWSLSGAPFLAIGALTASQMVAFLRYGRGENYLDHLVYANRMGLDVSAWVAANTCAQALAIIVGMTLAFRFPRVVNDFANWQARTPQVASEAD